MSETVRLMLVAPCIDVALAPLAAALEAVEVACVLVVPPSWQPAALDASNLRDFASEDPPMSRELARKMVERIQHCGAAALIANDAEAAKAVGADGYHLDTTEDIVDVYTNGRKFLGTDAVVGSMPGPSRHAAMTLAEAGVDYIGYPVTTADHHDPGLKFIAWWAEIFEIPVVAFAPLELDTCRRVIEAGPPDFIAVSLPLDDGGVNELKALAKLCAEEGHLPIAEKNAK